MEHFFSKYPTTSFQKNVLLIQPNDEISSIYYLISGKVRMYSISKEGEEITLHIFNEKSYLPLMFALANKKSSYYFQAMDNVIAQKASTDEVLQYLKDNPTELFNLTTRFSFAINGLTQRIETLAFENAYHKVKNLLQYFGQKYGSTVPFTHDEIASWLGLKRETVSRQIEKLQKEGVAKYENNKLTVTNITE